MWLESLCSFTDDGRGGPELSWNDLWGVVWSECQSPDKFLAPWVVTSKGSSAPLCIGSSGVGCLLLRLCSAKGSHTSKSLMPSRFEAIRSQSNQAWQGRCFWLLTPESRANGGCGLWLAGRKAMSDESNHPLTTLCALFDSNSIEQTSHYFPTTIPIPSSMITLLFC